MAQGLKAPTNTVINFAPSERQFELWKLLEPNKCPHCGGEIEQKQCGWDRDGHPTYKPCCVNCGSFDLPQLILGGGAAGGGKALPLDSSICTPFGFKKLSDIKVGDTITNPDTGGAQKVIWLHPIETHDYYRIHFEDGTYTDCSEGHLWECYESDKSDSDEIRTALDIYNWYEDKKNGGVNAGSDLFIPVTKPVKFNIECHKPRMNPYVFGTLIGGKTRNYCIPGEYKIASVEERIALIKGLIDTSGYIDNKGRTIYATISKELAEDVAWVVRSLGGIATITKNNANYDVQIRTTNNWLTRKGEIAEGKVFDDESSELSKRIVDVWFIGRKEGRCISVNDPSGLYVTDNFTVTHNSFLGSAWLISSCMRFSDIRMVVARKTLKSLKASTFNTIKTICKNWGLKENVNYKVNNLEGVMTFWNDSVIILQEMCDLPSDPNFERFGSSEYTGAFVDEVSEISEKAVEVLLSRLRWNVANTFKYPRMLLTTNPTINWVRSRFVQDGDGNKIKCKEGETYLPFSVFDNPDEEFVRAYVGQLDKISDKATRERLKYGNWDFVDTNDSAAYWNFDGNKHLVTNLKEKVYNPLNPIILSFDFNVMPFMSCLAFQINYEDQEIYVLEEILGTPEKKENNTPALAEKIRRKYLNEAHTGGLLVTGDPAGAARSTQTEDGVNNYTILVSKLDDPALRPQKKLLSKQPPQASRLEFVNALLSEYDDWTIMIDMRCRRFTEDLIYQKKNEDGTKNKSKVMDPKLKVKYEQYGHLSDCFDYFLCLFIQQAWNKFKTREVATSVTTTTSSGIYNAWQEY